MCNYLHFHSPTFTIESDVSGISTLGVAVSADRLTIVVSLSNKKCPKQHPHHHQLHFRAASDLIIVSRIKMHSAYYVNMPPGVKNANKDDLTCLHVHPSWAADVTKISSLQAIQQLQRFERRPLPVWELGLECHHGQVIHGDWPMQGIAECYLQASKLRDWLPTNINSGNCQEQNNRVFLLSGTIARSCQFCTRSI